MTKYFAGIGSRKCPPEICELMHGIGYKLASMDWVLRSGGADGADTAFQNGVQDYCTKNNLAFSMRQEIYLPWIGFRDMSIYPGKGIYWVDPAENNKIEALARIYHPRFNELGRGAKKLIMRNGHQILGKDLTSPTNMVICWTRDGSVGKTTSKHTGGTGHALRIAYDCRINIYNLANETTEWMFGNWLKNDDNELF